MDVSNWFIKRTILLVACFVVLAYLMNVLNVVYTEKFMGTTGSNGINTVRNERFVAGGGGCPVHENCPFGGNCPYRQNMM